jgi:flagellar assembly protein FliH
MTRALILEDFGDDPGLGPSALNGPHGPGAAQAKTDEDRLAIYEAGYQSGWDDCASAEAESQRRIGADLAANLQDLSLTYAEARRDVLASLGPLFEQMAAQLLPVLAAEAVAPAVIADLLDAASHASDTDIILLAAPAAVPALERLVEAQDGLAITVKPETVFADGQVSIRFGDERRDIDLTDAAERMAAAIRSFAEQAGADPVNLDQGAA